MTCPLEKFRQAAAETVFAFGLSHDTKRVADAILSMPLPECECTPTASLLKDDIIARQVEQLEAAQATIAANRRRARVMCVAEIERRKGWERT